MPKAALKPVKRIMVFGTFDILHKGHLHFFRQARKLAKKPFLIVSVARDVHVKRIKKTKPLYSERQRLEQVRALKDVDKAVLGGVKNYLAHIKKERPHLIALGYDQRAYTSRLQNNLLKIGLNTGIIRLKPYRHTVYKSSLIKRKMKNVL